MLNYKLTEGVKNAWLLSFIDLVMLLTCFFVMIYAALSHDNMKQAEVVNSLKDKFNFSRTYNHTAAKLELLQEILSRNVKSNDLAGKLSIVSDKNSVGLVIPYAYLFETSHNEESYQKLIGFLNNLIYRLDNNKIEVQVSIVAKDLLSNPNLSQQFMELYEEISKTNVGSKLSLTIVPVKPNMHDTTSILNNSLQIRIYENDSK